MILVCEFMDEVARERLAADFEVIYAPDFAENRAAQERIGAKLGTMRALIVRNRTQVDGTMLRALPQLECVGRLGVGLDNIDVEACKARNIAVYPATGANGRSVAEYVIAAILLLHRPVFLRQDEMRAGAWPRATGAGHEVEGRVLGIIGYGEIGQRTARLASALGLQILAHDPYCAPANWDGIAKNCTLQDLLSNSDIVSLHAPLTPDTHHLVNAESLALMRPGALLINTARGGLIDEAALAEALAAEKIGGVALDVFADEPLGSEAAARFGARPNVLLTPHIGGVTAEAQNRVAHMIADRVMGHLKAAP